MKTLLAISLAALVAASAAEAGQKTKPTPPRPTSAQALSNSSASATSNPRIDNTLRQEQRQDTRVNSQNRNRNTNTNRIRNTNDNLAYNEGNSLSYNAPRDRLQAPSVYGSFSSVSGGAPCDGVPFGIGGSGPGFGGLFQLPRESARCWQERQAERLMVWGCRNAALAVYAGNPMHVALNNNPCEGAYARAIKAKY